MAFEFVEHTGDAAIRIRAKGAEELVQDAAAALLRLYIENADSVPCGEAKNARSSALVRDLSLETRDAESLIVDFLAELIWLFDRDGFLCTGVEIDEVSLDAPARLTARLIGEKYDAAHHVFLTEVKAATYHGLSIERDGDRLDARIVFDL